MCIEGTQIIFIVYLFTDNSKVALLTLLYKTGVGNTPKELNHFSLLDATVLTICIARFSFITFDKLFSRNKI